ncbi:MAG: Histidine triad domain protein [Parcubacteria group bacterium]|nr:Histidine triad domain protein [Parcubacteria group bacterium]
MNDSDLLNLKHAREPKQKALMEQIIADGVCPFCAEYFKKYHPKPIIKETDYWFLTENMSPYPGTKYHFILVYKPAHIRTPSEIAPEGAADLFALLDWAIAEYKIPGGSFFMRFGDTRYNGSSVQHLHGQLIMGDVDAPGHEPVRVKLG